MKKYLFSCILCFVSCIYASNAQQTKNNQQLDSLITAYLPEVNPDSIKGYMQDLENFGTRYEWMPNRKEVAEWVQNKFVSFGFINAQLDSFMMMEDIYDSLWNVIDTVPSWHYNVVSTIEGIEKPQEYFIIGAHHDSYRYNWDTLPPIWEGGPAPGADDNASGVAGVLEIARIMKMKGYQSNYSIQFITFAAEEVGLKGSKAFVDKAVSANMNIKFMLNMDMIAYGNLSDSVSVSAYPGSEWLANILDSITRKYTTLYPLHNTSTYLADAGSFGDSDYYAISLTESRFNSNYHQATDLVVNCNMNYCAEVVRTAFGTLLQANETDSILGINNKLYNTVSVNLYPNPSNGIFNLEIKNIDREDLTIEIVNINGQLVYNKQINKSTLEQIDLSQQPKGMYFIKAYVGDKMFVKRIIIN